MRFRFTFYGLPYSFFYLRRDKISAWLKSFLQLHGRMQTVRVILGMWQALACRQTYSRAICAWLGTTS